MISNSDHFQVAGLSHQLGACFTRRATCWPAPCPSSTSCSSLSVSYNNNRSWSCTSLTSNLWLYDPRPVPGHPQAAEAEDPGGAQHPVQGGADLGARAPPRLPHPCDRPPRHGEHHALGPRVRDEQPALPHLRLPARLLHPHGDHGRDLRPDCPPSQEAEAGVGNPDGRQAPDHQEQSALSRYEEIRTRTALTRPSFSDARRKNSSSVPLNSLSTVRNGHGKYQYNYISGTETSHR